MSATVTQTAKTAPSPEDISQQIETLRADLMKLASTITGDVAEGVDSAGRQISQTGRDARETATNAVLEHPLAAVGIAAGLGLLLGLVVRKG
ncbi:glycine zipper domain-containing protein [Roseovarius autotrophicus]|uniref:glycine zipper domain-containing protein n=1 Tax=Roseovarius autotrophicus TaxID=2824121 RepID=UPI001A0A8D1E|nr:hypothetical protein [Roseovarius autotrophicus]MBE0453239.1 hypothetical protein [Roseovarius sp.]